MSLSTRLDELTALVEGWTRQCFAAVELDAQPFRQMIAYHLGWASEDLSPLTESVPAGKRLRPALCLLVAEAACGEAERAAAPAVAVELVHNFSLVHDDIQDSSPLRRHRPTIWSLWGTPQAINVGDAIFALAQLALYCRGLPRPPAETTLEATQRLNRTCLALVEGQYLDLALERVHEVSLAEYQRMVDGKTAALFRCACELGALYAGAPSEVVAAYGAFGHQLGRAFQFQDDLLGVWGEANVTGKSTATDLRSKKKGLPAALAFERLSGADAQRLRTLYHSRCELDDAEVEELLAILDRGGIRPTAERLVEQGYAQALAALERGRPSNPAAHHLSAIVTYLTTRQT